MENILKRKLHLGISACMYGAKVRYNAKGWDMLGELGRERASFLWEPVCPEVMSGLGVPRSSIRLSGGNGHDFWEGKASIKNRLGENMSEMIKAGSLACQGALERAKIDAFIFMEGSPSCGVYRTSLKNKKLGNPPGVFGALLLENMYFLIPAQDLFSPIKWWDWRRRLTTFVWVKEHKLEELEDLKKIWHIVRLLCSELDSEFSTKFAGKLAKISVENSEELNIMRSELLSLLRKPTDVEKLKVGLWKNYCHMKDYDNIEVPDVLPPEALRSHTHLSGELTHVEIEAKKKGLFFGSSPILYLGDR
ncbi:MAG: DUF523 domain-containing protein [Fusobacteriaceae bacterium]